MNDKIASREFELVSRKQSLWSGKVVGWDLVEITLQNAAGYTARGAQCHCRVGRAPAGSSCAGPSARTCVGHSEGCARAWLHQEKVRAGNSFLL